MLAILYKETVVLEEYRSFLSITWNQIIYKVGKLDIIAWLCMIFELWAQLLFILSMDKLQ
jgi:hypothetical protein